MSSCFLPVLIANELISPHSLYKNLQKIVKKTLNVEHLKEAFKCPSSTYKKLNRGNRVSGSNSSG